MLQEKFSFLSEPELLEEIGRTGRVLSFRQGETIVEGEKYAKTIPLILQGTVKALRVNESYSEIFLYYLTTGQACATSLMSCLTNKPSNLKAIAEEDTILMAVSAANARKWFGQFPSWREFVLLSLNECMEELIATIDSAFYHPCIKTAARFPGKVRHRLVRANRSRTASVRARNRIRCRRSR